MRTSRRAFLQSAGVTGAGALAGACAPGASQLSPEGPGAAAGTGQTAWEREWVELAAAAKAEGRVVVNWIHNQLSPRKALDAFEAAFPGITVELTTFASGSLYNPKVLQEMSAGIFTWDLTLMGAPFGIALRDAEALDPIRPYLFRPDVMEDKSWRDGFEAGFDMEKENKWTYGFLMELGGNQWYINTDLVREGEVRQIRDLLNPKWRERMTFSDPRQGATFTVATAVRLGYGEDVLKGIFVEQQPVYTREDRSIAESLVRGKHAIGMGASVSQFLSEFQAEGLGKNVKKVLFPDLLFGSVGSLAWVLRKPPHPNALKLFLNWLLTREGQTAYVQSTTNNSRRLDVPPGNPDSYIQPEMKLLYTRGNEQMSAEEQKTQRILLELIR